MANVRVVAEDDVRRASAVAVRPGAADCDARRIRSLMWDAVGVTRDGAHSGGGGQRAAGACIAISSDRRRSNRGDEACSAASSLATVGWLMAKAALRREESRGAHFRTDFPAKDDLHWKIHVAENR